MADVNIPEIVPMHYKLLPLTIQESKQAKYWGWNWVSKNRDRLVDADNTNYELQTYDRGFTCVVYNNTVYHVERDFIDMESNCRIFVARQINLNTDIMDDDKVEETTDEVDEEPQNDESAN